MNNNIQNISTIQKAVYTTADGSVSLDVQISQDSVWLSQQQMAELFATDRTSIGRHIHNIYKTAELQEQATCAKIAQVRPEGQRQVLREIPFYNLDMIISVGYRVNSRNATIFRQWATNILRQYLLHGYAINQRIERLEERVSHTERQIESFVHQALPPREGIFFDGEIYDAFELIVRIIKSAKQTILLIDNYIDDTVLTMMSEKDTTVKVDIYTKDVNNTLQLAETRFNAQYGGLTLHQTNIFHDRFLIIDDTTIYLIGASLKDAGKRLFAFTLLNTAHIMEIKSRL